MSEARIRELLAQIRKLKKDLANAKALEYTCGMSKDPKVTGAAGGRKGSSSLTSEQRSARAKTAAAARWKKGKK